MKTKKILDETFLEKVESMKLIARAINHPLRLEILGAILDENRKTTFEKNCVTDIYTAVGVEQSVASQHLSILKKAKVVESDRVGKFIFYEINKELIDLIKKIPLGDEGKETKKEVKN